MKGLKEYVKTMINSLLTPYVDGLTVEKLLKEYADEDKPLPYKELGFNSPLDFLKSIPDVVRVSQKRSGLIVLYAVANENLAHLHEFVQGQKNSNGIGSRVMNRLTNSNSSYRKPFNFPSAYNNRTDQSNNYSYEGNRNNSSFTSSYNTSRGNGLMPLPEQAFQMNMPPPPLCADFENQLLVEFENLLKSYPDGISITHIFAAYANKYPKALPIAEPGPLIAFFERHWSKFNKWKKDGNTMVSLASARNSQPAVPAPVIEVSKPNTCQPLQDMGIKTGAVPKVFSPQRLPAPTNELEMMTPEPATNQFEWAARDIRLSSPSKRKNMQTKTEIWNATQSQSSPTANPTLRKVAPVTVRAPLRDGNLPATFGVPKPTIPNVCTPGTEIPRQILDTECNEGYFFIVVAEVYSPGEFYWFLSENRRAIETLTDDLTLFYSVNPDDYEISRREMYIGQIVAAMYTDNLWYRARIVACYHDEFQVFYIDYGSKTWVTIDRIRHLDLHFTQLPVQAFGGRIFGIRHLPNEKKWSMEAGKWFLDLVKGSKIIAAMKMDVKEVKTSSNEIEPVYTLALTDTTVQDKDVHINDYLIENGFAVIDENAFRDMKSTVLSFDANSLVPVSSPSPLPTCAFPLSVSNSLADQQLENGNTPLSNHRREPSPTSPGCYIQNGQTPSVSFPENLDMVLDKVDALSISSSEQSSRRLVKRIVLPSERKLYTVNYEGNLFLTKFDLLVLIPNLERQMLSFKMGIENKLITVQSHPQIFTDSFYVGAPWIVDNQNERVTQLTLYSIKHVLSLLFLFSKEDKEALSVLKDELEELKKSFEGF